MTWHLEGANPDCKGIAVVDDDTGEIVDCYESEDEAQARLAQLRAEAPPPKRSKSKEG